jgi:hypothetical protein
MDTKKETVVKTTFINKGLVLYLTFLCGKSQSDEGEEE